MFETPAATATAALHQHQGTTFFIKKTKEQHWIVAAARS
jgi:hypothetical protein